MKKWPRWVGDVTGGVAHGYCRTQHRSAIVKKENQSVQSYAVIIHEDPESGFWAEVPALPDCYSQGETVDELKHNIPEAIGDSPR